jgi:hypothetical protein
MIHQYIQYPAVSTLASSLCNALLKQEQFFLANYANATSHPDYIMLTRRVNEASQSLANCLDSKSIPIAFSHKITLVDDSMDIKILADKMSTTFGKKISMESRTSSQFIIYTTSELAIQVKSKLYKTNRQLGLISCFNVTERTKRPYIVGLHTWQDARSIKQILLSGPLKVVA